MPSDARFFYCVRGKKIIPRKTLIFPNLTMLIEEKWRSEKYYSGSLWPDCFTVI